MSWKFRGYCYIRYIFTLVLLSSVKTPWATWHSPPEVHRHHTGAHCWAETDERYCQIQAPAHHEINPDFKTGWTTHQRMKFCNSWRGKNKRKMPICEIKNFNTAFTPFTGQNVVIIMPKAHHKEWQKCIPSESGILVIYKFAGLDVSHVGSKD